MKILVFEDEPTLQLRPVTTGRPAMLITVAGNRLLDQLRQTGLQVGALVRPHLTAIIAADYPDLWSAEQVIRSGESVLAINARTVPSQANLDLIHKMIEEGKPGKILDDGALAAAVLTPESVGRFSIHPTDLLADLGRLPDTTVPTLAGNLELLKYPHDIIAAHMRLMPGAMERRIATEDWRQLQDGVFVKDGVHLGAHTVFDTSTGPILLDRNVRVGPFCYFRGPIYAGPGAKIIEYASLKDAVAIGHTTKIGGEVEASIVEPYSNKQHHGFLGHSYLGSWINLGAGTCNSDLKNTYGTINMEYDGVRVATQMQFLGCIVGDYTKSAINTGIFTGKVIGVCAMLYGFITTNVPGFVNYARLFGQVADLPPEVMIATQGRMFARRNVPQRECDRDLIRDMYELTAPEREAALQQWAGL